MLEECIIKFCSPTLAKLKVGNIFSLKQNDIDIDQEIRLLNVVLNPKGINVVCLKRNKSSFLIYVYRKTLLQLVLRQKEHKEFLTKFNYSGSLNILITHLSSRLKNTNEFPHEIGVFLGYPLEDIKSYIKNKGKNELFVGYWKVYSNIDFALLEFRKFSKCKKIYSDIYFDTKDIQKLTVRG